MDSIYFNCCIFCGHTYFSHFLLLIMIKKSPGTQWQFSGSLLIYLPIPKNCRCLTCFYDIWKKNSVSPAMAGKTRPTADSSLLSSLSFHNATVKYRLPYILKKTPLYHFTLLSHLNYCFYPSSTPSEWHDYLLSLFLNNKANTMDFK